MKQSLRESAWTVPVVANGSVTDGSGRETKTSAAPMTKLNDEAANAQDNGDIEEDIEEADHQAEVDAAAEDVRARRSRAKELFGELVDILIQ